MGILGIQNRTENWKTAESFCGLSEKGRANLVQKLCKTEVQPREIRLELFWYGMRDYIHQHGGAEEAVADIYRREFSDLRWHIESFEHNAGKRTLTFSELQPHNYDVSTPGNRAVLYDNVTHSEIDIVLETSNHLFIGEAKDESGFGADGKLILVHQLIRQYVMAKILVDLKDVNKEIVPFIVGDPDKLESIRNTVQVGFMIDRDWLKECNILSWDYINQLSQ